MNLKETHFLELKKSGQAHQSPGDISVVWLCFLQQFFCHLFCCMTLQCIYGQINEVVPRKLQRTEPSGTPYPSESQTAGESGKSSFQMCFNEHEKKITHTESDIFTLNVPPF